MIRFDGIYTSRIESITDETASYTFKGFYCSAYLFGINGMCHYLSKRSTDPKLEFRREEFWVAPGMRFVEISSGIHIFFYEHTMFARYMIFKWEGDETLICTEAVENDGTVTVFEQVRISFQPFNL